MAKENFKYSANFSVNNGTTLSTALLSNNKAKLRKDIRECAMGERFAGSTGRYWIADAGTSQELESWWILSNGQVRKREL